MSAATYLSHHLLVSINGSGKKRPDLLGSGWPWWTGSSWPCFGSTVQVDHFGPILFTLFGLVCNPGQVQFMDLAGSYAILTGWSLIGDDFRSRYRNSQCQQKPKLETRLTKLTPQKNLDGTTRFSIQFWNTKTPDVLLGSENSCHLNYIQWLLHFTTF